MNSDKLAKSAKTSYLLKLLHEWHWISSAICLVGMLLFTITGITLNHADIIEGKAKIINKKIEFPKNLFQDLEKLRNLENQPKNLPENLQIWLYQKLKINTKQREVEWNEEEIYVSLPKPGGDSWLRIDLETREIEYEDTSRGLISYLNDLHKGRNTGKPWKWFIDIIAVGSLIFCLTGLFILYLHSKQRPMTWPLTGLGLIIPFLLALLLIH